MSGFAELGAQAIAAPIEDWLGNVFGANNSPPIVDIQNALLQGHYSNITSQSWAMAGLPDGGGQWLINFLQQHGFTVNPLTGQPLSVAAAAVGVPMPAAGPVSVTPAPPAGVQHLIGPVGVLPLGYGNTRYGPTGTQPFAPYFGPQGTPYEAPAAAAAGGASSLMTPSAALGGLSPALALGIVALFFLARR